MGQPSVQMPFINNLFSQYQTYTGNVQRGTGGQPVPTGNATKTSGLAHAVSGASMWQGAYPQIAALGTGELSPSLEGHQILGQKFDSNKWLQR